MRNRIINITLIVLIMLTINSCKAYAKFEIGRYMLAFIISLIIGVIGLISMNGKNKK